MTLYRIMDRNTVIAFFLIALVIFLWPLYMEYVSPPQPSDQTPAPVTTEPGPPPATTSEQPASKPVAITEQHSTPVSPASGGELLADEARNINININHDLYQARISNRGGGSLLSFQLKNYQKYDSSLVELIYPGNQANLLLAFTSAISGQKIVLDNRWSYQGSRREYSVGAEPVKITFTTSYNNQPLTKTLVFHPGTYQIDVLTNLAGVSNHISQGSYTLGWNGGLPGTEKNTKDDYNYFKGYVYQGDDLHTPRAKSELKLERFIGQTRWAAFRTKYFITSLIPETPASAAEIGGYVENGEKTKRNIYSFGLFLDSQHPNSTTLYLGPLEYKRVKGLGVSLERVMNFGWSFIRPIAKGVLFLLTKMHKTIPNYGVVLIIFAILVKIIVYPLTKKSFQSTKEMQAVQPLVAELKEKHKSNPQKLNQETMNLYKEHGVNPLGGCLPLLLQMPLLFALFQVFRSTIELRGAHFIWWIKDLSSPDTIFYLPFTIPIYGDQVSVLPIIMGVSMFLQQKMMPTQASGQQKYMSYFMTGFFMLLFNNFPSGLNLYYTLFNILTIVQQKYLTPAQKQPVVSTKSKPKAARGR